LSTYAKLISDRVRTDAYWEALRRVVTPDTVVLDIGTGCGIFACMACELGARKVYAIEPTPMVQLARAIATANGYGDRIEFIQDLSTAITLPEPADVVVSDLRGVIPLFEHHIPSIADARQRLLRRGGTCIPQMDVISGAIVEAENLYDRRARPWLDRPYGIDMGVVTQFSMNSWFNGRANADQLLTDACRWAVLDYRTIAEADVRGDLSFTVGRDGTAHGLCLWFDSALTDGVEYSSSPAAQEPALIYGNGFFPFRKPASVTEGDRIVVKLDARLRGDDYIWSWSTTIRRAAELDKTVEFRQSTFFSGPSSGADLQKHAPTYVPSLTQVGQIDVAVLRLMDGKASVEQIARCLTARFPGHFASHDRAVAHVAELAERYS
jgi:protein arginine N-methyltransferase 1